MKDGIVDVRSQHSVVATIDRLEAKARAAGLTVFARIDFSGDAARTGMAMRPMQALLFGNPRAGTPILAAAPHAGLDLPLRALAWEDASGAVWISSNTPDYVGQRHDVPEPLLGPLRGARGLIEAAAATD
ncbi:MAG TPA: DUF302 domain-containing protein [Polyangia bacterium]|nr:DUF302 domain-containing protein [Polyangia bacterium]